MAEMPAPFSDGDIKDYFVTQLDYWFERLQIQKRKRLSAYDEYYIEEYILSLLVGLLSDSLIASGRHSPAAFQDLRWGTGAAAGEGARRRADTAFCIAGLYAPHLKIRRHADIGWAYELLAQALYATVAARLSGLSRGYIFRFFAEDLHPYVEVLNQLSVEGMVWNRDQDVEARLARYIETRRPEDLEWLIAHGISLRPSPDKKIIILGNFE